MTKTAQTGFEVFQTKRVELFMRVRAQMTGAFPLHPPKLHVSRHVRHKGDVISAVCRFKLRAMHEG